VDPVTTPPNRRDDIPPTESSETPPNSSATLPDASETRPESNATPPDASETPPRASRLERFERSLTRSLFTVKDLAVWPMIYAIAVGVSAWLALHPGELGRVAKGAVPVAERTWPMIYVAVAAGALLLTYGLAMSIQRVRRGVFDPRGVTTSMNRQLALLAAAPFVLAIATPKIESTSPIWTMLLCGGAALFVAKSAYVLPLRSVDRPPTANSKTALKWVTASLLLLMAAAYSYRFSTLAITNHEALVTRTIDLGYYDNIFYQSLHGRPLNCTFCRGATHASAHFDPILVLLSQFYRISGRAELLLVLQSVWLSTGVIPTYLLAHHKLGSRLAGLALGAAYLLYPALHGANMYEFHSLTLIAPLMLWLLFFLERRQWLGYGISMTLLLLCREDVPLLLCLVGVYGLLTRQAALVRAGWITILVSLVYMVSVRLLFMPSSAILNSGTKHAYSYEYYFRDLIPKGTGLRGLLSTFITNPVFVMEKAFANNKKILYLLQLLLPLGMLPLFAAKRRVMLLYGLGICLLASRPPVFSTHFQYSCTIFPIAFAILPSAIADMRNNGWQLRALGIDSQRFSRAAVTFVLVATALSSFKFGGIVNNTAFKGGFARVTRTHSPATRKRYQAVRRMVDKIPPGASVAATNRLGPHISNRQHAYMLRQAKTTDYEFVDTEK